MRRSVCAAITIFLAGCCTSIPTGRPIRENLQALRNDIVAFRAPLHPLRCGASRCYAVSEVNALFALIDQRLQTAFPPEAAPLTESLKKILKEERARLGDPQLLSPIWLVRMPPDDSSAMGLQAEAVEDVLQKFVALLNDLIAQSFLTLEVSSEPREAQFVVVDPSGKHTNPQVITNDKRKVVRALYTTTIHKNGYKDTGLDLDLLYDKRARINCKLYKVTEPDNSSCQRY